jgi:hypothetical protein
MLDEAGKLGRNVRVQMQITDCPDKRWEVRHRSKREDSVWYARDVEMAINGMCKGFTNVLVNERLLEDQSVDNVIVSKVPERMRLEDLVVLVEATTIYEADSGGGVQLLFVSILLFLAHSIAGYLTVMTGLSCTARVSIAQTGLHRAKNV